MSLGGDEYALDHGDYHAVVTEVGGGLRALRSGDRDLIRPYAVDQVRPRYRGSLLAPWPNRVVDGAYSFDGASYQLDLTEPERGHALHGLVCWSRFEFLDRTADSVVLQHRIVPRTGYPFELTVEIGYQLTDEGLQCGVRARNTGDRPAPYGVAAHPYLVAGPGRVDDWELLVPAAEVLETTPDRLIPTERRPVEATERDFRLAHRIAATQLDHAFTALVPEADGRARAHVRGADGRGTELSWDPAVLPWAQVHTGDLPDPDESRRGVALEPMTCPPDAFNSGTDLVVLAPGDEHAAAWTISAL